MHKSACDRLFIASHDRRGHIKSYIIPRNTRVRRPTIIKNILQTFSAHHQSLENDALPSFIPIPAPLFDDDQIDIIYTPRSHGHKNIDQALSINTKISNTAPRLKFMDREGIGDEGIGVFGVVEVETAE
jgi:hypothetical protein